MPKQVDGRWVVEFQQRGIRVHRRLPALATKADALALESRLRREIFQQTDLGQKPSVTLDAAVQMWLEAVMPHRKDKAVAQRATYWRGRIEGKPLTDVSNVAEEAKRAWSRLKPATINARLNVLKATLKYAYRRGWSESNLSSRVALLPVHNKREVYLTAGEVRRLALAADPAVRAAIMLSAYTGLRAGELLALTAADVTKDSVIVRDSKTHKPRIVPVPKVVRSYLRVIPFDMAYRTLVGRFWEVRERAGLPHVRWHDLRHTCASMLINLDVDLYTVGRILGHTATVTTARYAHLSHDTLKKAMEKLR